MSNADSSSGLQRRRVHNTSTADSSSSGAWRDEDDDDKYRGKGTTTTTTNSTTGNGTTGRPSVSHAGSAFAHSGSKIAYDPHEQLESAGEEQRVGGRLPRLTLLEEVMLLAVKDKQGYLSFWNDNISYVLRGCILIELALRRRIAMVRDPNRRRVPIADRLLEVIDTRPTGETILDEALKLIKGQQETGEKWGVGTWVDLMSGETWNITKVGFQLKQVRERLLKGLVDKGILRTEQRNFLLFDMATHPLADVRTKEGVINRVVSTLTMSTSAVPESAIRIPAANSGGGDRAEGSPDEVQCRVLRTVCLVCAAYAGSVLDNAFGRLGYEDREAAFGRCDDVLSEFVVWPFGSHEAAVPGAPASNPTARRAAAAKRGSTIASGGSGDVYGRESVLGLVREARKEAKDGDDDLCFELVASVLEVLGRLDSLL